MHALLKLARRIDALTELIGRSSPWLVLAVVLISTANALMRYAFNYSLNAFLEIQWYLFGMIFLLTAGYTLLRNEHVRIDIISSRFSQRGQSWIDILGIVFFLLPSAILVMTLSWPVFVDAWNSGEMSNSADGLIVWPARLMIPVGFFLLIMQAVSELIKRIGFLLGLCADPAARRNELSAEQELARAIKAQQGDA